MRNFRTWIPVVVVAALTACGGGDDDDGDDDDDDVVTIDAAPPAPDVAVPDAPPPPPDATPLLCDEFGPAEQGTNSGFVLPGVTLQAYKEIGGVWTLQGPANFDCLCGGGDDRATEVEVALSGYTRDFQTFDIVDNVDIDMFAYGDSPGGIPIVNTTSDASGQYSLTLPIGTGRVDFRMTDPEGSRFLPSTLFHHRLDPSAASQSLDLTPLSLLTANALPAFVGIARTEGLGLAAGTVVDCDGNQVDGAIATVSATPRTSDHLSGAATYYFSAGSTSLPVRHTQALDTNHDGLFIVIEMPPTPTAYMQAWGYLDGQTPGVDPITLLSEIQITVAAESWGHAILAPMAR